MQQMEHKDICVTVITSLKSCDCLNLVDFALPQLYIYIIHVCRTCSLLDCRFQCQVRSLFLMSLFLVCVSVAGVRLLSSCGLNVCRSPDKWPPTTNWPRPFLRGGKKTSRITQQIFQLAGKVIVAAKPRRWNTKRSR